MIDQVLLALVFAYFSALFFRLLSPQTFIDMAVYYEAGAKALAHRTVYDVEGHMQYKYSPFVALIFGALPSVGDFADVSFWFYKLSVVAWAIFGYWLLRVAGIADSSARVRAGFLLVLFLGYALKVELKLGQVNIIPMALVVLFFVIHATGRRDWKALLWMSTALSLAVQFKLYCVLVGPFLLFRRDWTLIVLGALNLIVLSVGGLALFHGLDFALAENLDWLKTLMASSSGLLVAKENVALLGVVAKWTGSIALAYAAWFVAIAAFLLLQFRLRNQALDSMALVLAAVPILNPLAWSYWILLTAPMLLQLWRDHAWKWSPATLLAAVFVWVFFFLQNAAIAMNGGIFIALLMVFAAWLVSRKSGSESGSLPGTP